jgi:hypothetical protein
MSYHYSPTGSGGPVTGKRRDRRRSGRLVKIAALVALLGTLGALVVAGCGESGGSGGSGGGTDTTVRTGDSVVHPTGAEDLILQVFAHDGFVTPSYRLTQLPGFSLYGDGTVIVTGPIPEIYPGSAMPNLQTTKISEDAIQAILSAAREAGLFTNDVDYGAPGITDMPVTSIVINANKTTYRSDIYALGMESGAGGLTMDQQQARAAIGDLDGKLGDLTSFQSGEIKWTPYQYSTLAVFSRAIDPSTVTDSTDVQPNRLEWPLGDLSTLGEVAEAEGYRKILVAGDLLTELQPLLAKATQITVWTFGDHEFNLFFRPLLPDETP